MNSRGLPGENCGQINSLVKLTQHVTQDLAHQESVSIPFISGLEQSYSLPPQSFRLDDLMRELQIEAPLADYAQNPWERELPIQFQSQNFQAWNEMNTSEFYKENPFSYGNFQNFSSPDFQCHVPQNFDAIVPQTEYELQGQHQSEECDQTEESYENVLINEADSDQSNNEICRPLEPIVEFDNPQKFIEYLKLQVMKYRTQHWEMQNPTEKFTEISKELLMDDTKRYSHIVKNPYRYHSDPYEDGYAALDEGNCPKAVLFFDEAVRQDNTDVAYWHALSFALLMNDQPDVSLLAIKELLRLDPGSLRGNMIASNIYHTFDCDYQACQSIFNYLKYNEKYNFLIPEDFEMNTHSETTELERHQLEAVLTLFCKAVQQNPIEDIDVSLQVAMSVLLELNGDFEKQIDCIRTTLLVNPTDDGRLIDLGYALFQIGNPYEAIDAYMKAFNCFKGRDEDIDTIMALDYACTGLGLVHMYLKNYKEANNWLMRTITGNCDFVIDERDSLEGEYDLCLRLYLEITDMVTFL